MELTTWIVVACVSLDIALGLPSGQKQHHFKRDVSLVELETELGYVVGRQETVLGKDLDVFLGVPYAVPPVGNRRFSRPKIIDPWKEPKMALELPSSCHQMVDTSFGQFPGVDMWNPNTNMSEDCLYLNIWAPSDRAKGETKAVMLWIFGGSFTLGSNTLDVYDGRILAAQGDVVVVSMQYRVGALGFLFLDDIGAPGNMGLLDQHVALRWVYDYIEAFGGDRNRITLFGESAGAASASFHLLAPSSRPFFKSSILQSASALSPWAVSSNETAIERSLSTASLVNCDRNAPTAEVLKCLKSASAQEISEQMWSIPGDLRNIIAPISPIVDGYFIQEQPLDTLKKGDVKNSDILLGMNQDEGTYFLVYTFQTLYNLTYEDRIVSQKEFRKALGNFIKNVPSDVVDLIAFEYGTAVNWHEGVVFKDAMDDVLGDYAFKCPVVDFANHYASHGNDVFMYNFKHRTSANPWPSWLGTMHGYEIDHVFGAPLNTSRQYTDQEKALSRQMVKYWSNFAKTMNPNLDENGHAEEIAWQSFTEENQNYIVLDADPVATMDTGLRYRSCAFWRDLVPPLTKAIQESVTCGSSIMSGSLCLLVFTMLSAWILGAGSSHMS